MIKKVNKKSSLKLNTETVRALGAPDLRGVAGGATHTCSNNSCLITHCHAE